MPMPGVPVDDSNIHNLKDILSTYNKITDVCFTRCAANFNYHSLTDDEEKCVDNCSGKFIRSNHSMMSTFMEIQSRKQQTMFEEALKQQQAAETATTTVAATTATTTAATTTAAATMPSST